MSRRAPFAGLAALALAAAGLVLTAGARPATAVAPAPLYQGPAFDTCQAPSLQAMQAWTASPYRGIGIYIGGANRACADGPLSRSWVAAARRLGWSLMPLYVGLQAPCVSQPGLATIDPGNAYAQGVLSALDAVSDAQVFGIDPGSPITVDLEAYDRSQGACVNAVLGFVSGWTNELHVLGYRSGAYGSGGSLVANLAANYANPAVARPDVLWFADWNGNPNVFGDRYVPDSMWTSHQRIHQYTGGTTETWGGVSIDIDHDTSDAPAAAIVPSVGIALGGAGGETIDAEGGVTPFGGAPGASGPPIWGGWHIVRGIALLPSGTGGYTLDGFGGVHPFAIGTGPAPPAPSGVAYWPGWDIVRGIALLPGGTGGYTVDGWGGVHPFGGAPAASGEAYWPGWDIVRGIAILPSGAGGYTLDGWGGVHPFAIGANPLPPVPSVTGYWPGWDIVRGIAILPGGAGGYTVDGWGGVHPFGGAPAASGEAYWPGWDIVRGIAILPSGAGGYTLDGWGGVHPFAIGG